jgi:hypothetical protein
MSRHETWRTRKFWDSFTGGLLIEEFLAIRQDRGRGVARRLIDGVIVLGEEKRVQIGGTFNLEDRDIVVVQTKATRLGMYLMGQTLFSREIIKRFKPRSIRAVAICGKGDPEMERLCESFEIEVVIYQDNFGDFV